MRNVSELDVFSKPGYSHFTENVRLFAIEYCNPSNHKSVEHKGRDCGLTKEDLVYLMQNPPFLQALREIMKNQLRSSEVAITAKMTGAALRGDTTASRIVLERVDKYDDVAKDKLKFQEVVTILVDAIQKHVRDPKVLENIMKDIKVVILAIEGGDHSNV